MEGTSSTPNIAPRGGATSQNEVQNTLGQILAEIGELRAELRERHDKLRSLYIAPRMILRATLSTSILYVGRALDPCRDMVGWSSLESSGWINRFTLHVPTLNPAGQHLRRISVGEAHGPHRIHINWDSAETNRGGWKPRLCFFVWEEAGPGRVMVSVAYTTDPWRWKLELGRHVGTRPEDAGWLETMTFWVPDW